MVHLIKRRLETGDRRPKEKKEGKGKVAVFLPISGLLSPICIYSYLKLSTGLARAALIDW